jgi:hypothetical protein
MQTDSGRTYGGFEGALSQHGARKIIIGWKYSSKIQCPGELPSRFGKVYAAEGRKGAGPE